MSNENILYYAGCYLPHARLALKKMVVFVELPISCINEHNKSLCFLAPLYPLYFFFFGWF